MVFTHQWLGEVGRYGGGQVVVSLVRPLGVVPGVWVKGEGVVLEVDFVGGVVKVLSVDPDSRHGACECEGVLDLPVGQEPCAEPLHGVHAFLPCV